MDIFRKNLARLFGRVGFRNQDVPKKKKIKSNRRREGFRNDMTGVVTEMSDARTECDIKEMSILNCRNLPSAIEFFESSSVRDELNIPESVLFIQFEIEDEFGEIAPNVLFKLNQISQGKAVVIYVAAKNESDFSIYWKSKDLQHFLMFKPYDGTSPKDEKKVYEFIANFVAVSLSRGELGILKDHCISPEVNKIELHSLADDRDFNLLLLAAESGKADIVRILLEMGISPESPDESVKAQDLAWDNNHCDVILTLLRANLPFPSEIEPNLCSNDLKKFIKTNEEIHEAILDKNAERVEEIRAKNPDQRHFYNISNESAAKVAIVNKSLEIYELLITQKVFFAHHEDEEEFWDDLEEDERRFVREIHFRHLKDLPEKHINILMAHSFVGHDVQNAQGKREHVLNAYKFLNSNPFLSVLLLVVVASKKLRSVFDFNRDSVYFTDPTTNSKTNGMFYLSGRVYVGAKQLLDQATKYQTYAVMAHEFCHYAINLTYGNNAKPYAKNDNQTLQEFEKISEKCQKNRDVEQIIDIVYDFYPPEMHHAELIVRVPHLMALYHDQPEKLKRIRNVFIELFEFYEKKIVPEMMSSLPEIERRDEKEIEKKDKKILNLKKILFWSAIFSIFAIILAIILGRWISHKPHYTFDGLSMDEKIMIKDGLVSYKNVEVKFNDLFPENSTAYKKLTSDHISQIFDRRALNFSDSHFLYLNDFIHHDWKNLAESLKHKFLSSNFTFQNESLKFQKLNETSSEIYNSLTSVEITDVLDRKNLSVGSMLSNDTEFYIERKFIFENSGKCFDFGNFSNTRDGFDDTIERTKRTRMFTLSSEAGAGKTVTFKQLTMRIKKKYPTRWVSYIDLKEHSRVYNQSGILGDIDKLMSDILDLNSKTEFERQIFKESFKTGNVVLLWNGFDEISPTYNKFIANVMNYIFINTTNVQYVCTRPLYSDQLQKLFNIKSNQLVPFGKDEQIEFLRKFFVTQNIAQESINGSIAKVRKISEKFDFNTPLMLKLIAEISTDGELINSQNLYKIYERFVHKKVKIWQAKGEFAQTLSNSLISGTIKFDIIEIYQKFALQSELEYLNMRKLNIMQLKLPKDLKFEEISRMGILYVNDEYEFAFAHKTFAEFFLAKYFIHNIYEVEGDLKVEEAEIRLETFFFAFKKYGDMQTIADFMGDYIDTQENNESQKFHPVIAKLLKTKFKKFFFEFLDTRNPKMFDWLFKFFKKDYEILIDMLQVNEDETLCTATYNPFYRPNVVQYAQIKNLTRNVLKDKDFQKFINGRNQKGKILFGMSFYSYFNKSKSHDEYDIGTEKVADNFLFDFLDRVKDNLTEPEQKELFIFLTNPRVYKSFNSFTITYYETLWSNYGQLLTKEETKVVIGSAFYWYLRYYYYAKFTEYESILFSLIKKSEEIMSDSDIYDMFIRENILHRAAFQRFTLEHLWNFFIKHSTNEQQLHMLLRNDTSGNFFYYAGKGFLNYLFDSSNFNVFHLSLIYAERDRRFFNYAKEMYLTKFNQTEMQEMILSSNDFMLYVAYYANEYTCKEFASYLETLFEANKESLSEFLKMKIRPTNWDIFEYFKGLRIDISGVLNVFTNLLERIQRID